MPHPYGNPKGVAQTLSQPQLRREFHFTGLREAAPGRDGALFSNGELEEESRTGRIAEVRQPCRPLRSQNARLEGASGQFRLTRFTEWESLLCRPLVLPAQHRVAGGPGFVEPAARRQVGR